MEIIATLRQYGLVWRKNFVWFDCESFDDPDTYLCLFKDLLAICGKTSEVEDML